MSLPFSRRQFLVGGGAGVATLLGGVVVHAATGPVALHILNRTSTERRVGVALIDGGQTAFEEKYTVPPQADNEVGVVTDEQVIEYARHGKTYEVELTVDGEPLRAHTYTYTPTCTGFTDPNGEDITDEVYIDLPAEYTPTDVRVVGNSCGSMF
jgi:hypothetical protein